MVKMVHFTLWIFNHDLKKTIYYKIHLSEKVGDKNMSTVKKRHGRYKHNSNQTSRYKKTMSKKKHTMDKINSRLEFGRRKG